MLRDAIFNPFLWILHRGDRLEHGLYLLNGLLRIHITDHCYSLQIRAIPIMIEVTKGLRLKRVDYVQVTDDITLRVLGILVDDRVDLQTYPETWVTAGSPLFRDHAPLAVNLFLSQRQIV